MPDSNTRVTSFYWIGRLYDSNILAYQNRVVDLIGQILMSAARKLNKSVKPVKVSLAEAGIPNDYLLLSHNSSTVLECQVEIRDDRVTYLHTIPNNGPDLITHLTELAQPILCGLLDSTTGIDMKNRLLKVEIGITTDLYAPVSVNKPRNPNERNFNFLTPICNILQPNTTNLLQELHASNNQSALEPDRIDLKFSTKTVVNGQQSQVWFDLRCPPNDDFSFLQAYTSVQNTDATLPNADWAINVTAIYNNFFQPVILNGFLHRLKQAASFEHL